MYKILSYLSWIDDIATLIWIILSFIILWILLRIYLQTGTQNKYFYSGILLIFILWLNPLYTSFFESPGISEIVNIFTLIITVLYKNTLKKYSIQLSRLLIPQVIWFSIAILYDGLIWIDVFLES
jgi:hypothetical protein